MFGEDVLAASSRSGCNETNQADPEKLLYIKSIVWDRVATRMNTEDFELVRGKCLSSISKKMLEVKI